MAVFRIYHCKIWFGEMVFLPCERRKRAIDIENEHGPSVGTVRLEVFFSGGRGQDSDAQTVIEIVRAVRFFGEALGKMLFFYRENVVKTFVIFAGRHIILAVNSENPSRSANQ